MTHYMTIGPVLNVGGNSVQLTENYKVRVTNPRGKARTFTQNEFKKQLVKNSDKLANGEKFEFEKENKALKIIAAGIGTFAVGTAILFRKEIGKYIKNFSFPKFLDDVEGLFRKEKPKAAEKQITKVN